MTTPQAVYAELADAVDALDFAAPVACVYNPLRHAHQAVALYLERFGEAPKNAVFLGMNPGPWGMVQSGIPFGDVPMVRDWMGIKVPIDVPSNQHPKRPIEGFQCKRREVSGSRFWGLIRDCYGPPEAFFRDHIVLNYCPLAFMTDTGRNLTPDKLPVAERNALQAVCDQALVQLLRHFQPRYAIGIGNFAMQRLDSVCDPEPDLQDIAIRKILHPSPASPAANRDWAGQAETQLREIGITLPASRTS